MKMLLFAGAALLAATPAVAQEAAPAGGARIELRGGWDNVAPVVTYTDQTGSQRISGGQSGFTYGTELGYDAVFGNGGFVGAYAGIAGSTTKSCDTVGIIDECLSAGRNVTAGVRVGFVLPHASMVYIKGGYSNGNLKIRDSSPVFSQDLVESQDLNGFHVGAGGELGLTPHFYTKLEYVYTHYEIGSIDLANARLRTTLDRHQVVGGVGYRF